MARMECAPYQTNSHKNANKTLAFVQKYVMIKMYDYGQEAISLCTFL